MLDQWISLFIFSPLVVSYWRGTWQLLDIFLLPETPCLSALMSFLLGTGIIVFLGVAQDSFTETLSTYKIGRFFFLISSRFYSIVFCFAGVNHWRGIWQMIECYAGISWITAIIAVSVGVAILAPLRTLRTVLSPPFTVVVDHEHDYFRMQTMFGTKINSNTCAFIADVLFSVLIIGSSVVLVWWGVWTLFDVLVYPDSVLWSSLTCCFVGFSIALVCFSLQSTAAEISGTLNWFTQIIFEDFFIFTASVGSITVWRGLWNLFNIYFLPDNECLSNSLTHTIGIIGLILLHSSNSVPVKGVSFDAQSADGSGCYFHVDYIVHIKELFKSCQSSSKQKIRLKPEFEKMLSPTSEKLKNERILQLSNSADSSENVNFIWIPRDPKFDRIPYLGIDRETVV